MDQLEAKEKPSQNLMNWTIPDDHRLSLQP